MGRAKVSWIGMVLVGFVLVVGCSPAKPEAGNPGGGQTHPSGAPAGGDQPAASPNSAGSSGQEGNSTAPAGANGVAPTTSAPALASPKAYEGSVTYVEGPVEIHRRADVLTNVQAGFKVQPYDLLVTGAKAALEIRIAGPGMPGSVLRLKERTQFYLENQLLPAGTLKTTAQLLAGSLQLKVEKLAGAQLKVQLTDATLGVRGTTFGVTLAPTQDLLVTCSEGQVAVERKGQAQLAQPGQAVAQAPGEALETFKVSVEKIPAFEDKWFTTVMSEFEVLAVPILKDLARTLALRQVNLIDKYQQVDAQKELLARWQSKVDQGQRLTTAELIADKKIMSPLLLKLKPLTFFLERQAAWLERSGPFLTPGLLSKDYGGQTGQAIVSKWKADRTLVLNVLSRIRAVYALYAAIDPESPLAEFFTPDQEDLIPDFGKGKTGGVPSSLLN